MTTDLTTRNGPVLLTQLLSPQDLAKHKNWIGIRVEAAMGHFWTDNVDMAVKAMMLADWMDVLAPFQPSEIDLAFRDWLRERAHKPKPADIRAIIIANRKSHHPVSPYRTKNEQAADDALARRENRQQYDTGAIIEEIIGSTRP